MIPTIVFDFDGTLAVGHGPVLAYARLVARSAGAGFLERVEAALAALGTTGSGYRDGYDAVGTLAAEDGVDAETLGLAYAASREQLGTELAPVAEADDLSELLERLRAHARLVLATNAPETGIERVLDAWGVREQFDRIHTTVGKPEGLKAIVREALAAGPVLAVGDIVEYDLAPAMELGADSALVGATAATSTAPVTMRGLTLAELAPRLTTWAAAAAARDHVPDGTANHNER